MDRKPDVITFRASTGIRTLAEVAADEAGESLSSWLRSVVRTSAIAQLQATTEGAGAQ